jgi:hypothetical protein
MGAISNITKEGFAPSGFHAFPSTLRIDHYAGDNGPGIFGHTVNTGTYVVDHPEFGWLAFGGNRTVDGDWVRVKPLDSSRSRVYLASMGAWLTLDAGQFEEVALNPSTGDVRVSLTPATEYTPEARLRVQQPAEVGGVGTLEPVQNFSRERQAYVVPLGDEPTQVTLQSE